MQDYDITLKVLITSAAGETLRLLGAPGPVRRWLNVELPKVQNQRVDLLAEIVSGQLLHIELQGTNVADMPQRMLEYGVGIWRLQGIFPQQILLYVGNDRLRMPDGFRSGGIDYRYQVVDIRDLDGEAMLESNSTSDNILALLTGIKDSMMAVRRIMGKIARLGPGKREDSLRKLLILCGLRGLERLYEREHKNMPVDLDIMDHKILGPAIRKGIAEGRAQGVEQGIAEGLEKGMQAEARQFLQQLLEKRFGAIPPWAEKRLGEVSREEAEELGLKFVDAKSLEEMFR